MSYTLWPSFPHIRPNEYQKRLAERFCELFNSDEYLSVEFGKQDLIGSVSITWLDKRHCVQKQIHFSDKSELFGYILGYLENNC